MADFTGELNLNSRRKPLGTIKTGDLKGGIKKGKLTQQSQAIFDAVNNKDASKGNVDDILDANEMNAFWEKLKEFAKNDKLSGREAKKLIKDFGLQDISKEDLFNFVTEIYGKSKDIESSLVAPDGTIIINYNKDVNGKKVEERISTNKTSELQATDTDGNVETKYLDANGKTKQFIKKSVNGDTETYTYTDADGNVVLDAEGKEVIVKYEALKNSGATKTTINYENGQEKDATVVEGALTSKFEYIDGKQVLKQKVENKGNDLTATTDYVYNKDNTITATTQEGDKKTVLTFVHTENRDIPLTEVITEGNKKTTNQFDYERNLKVETIEEGDNTTQNLYQMVKADDGTVTLQKSQQYKKVNGKEYQVQYDENGNTLGVVVQNGESPSAIAKKFGCTVDELFAANPDLVRGKGNSRYFNVGETIKIPKMLEADDKALQGRKSADDARAAYAQDAQENQQLKALGLQDTKGAGKKYTAKDGKTYTIVGNAAYERTIVKDKAGNLHVFAKNGTDLKLDYVGNDVALSNSNEYVRVVRDGKARYIETKARDAHGRHNMIDWQGNNVGVLAGQNQKGQTQVELKDRKVLDPAYVQGSDLNDEGLLPSSYVDGITYHKQGGKTFYFRPPAKGSNVGGFIDAQEAENKIATAICEDSLDAAKRIGTKNEKFQKAAAGIVSPSLMAKVNNRLKGTEFDKDNGYSAYENLILDENNHGSAQKKYFQIMVDNGAYTPAEAARLGRKEIEHEISGSTGTEDVKRAMKLINSPEARRILEQNGFDIRKALEDDGWNETEINRFEATWVKNNAYEAAVLKRDENGNVVYENGKPVYLTKGDQEHRNMLIGALMDDMTDESRNIVLDAIDTDNITTREMTADYAHFLGKAAEINNKVAAKPQFNGQDAGQVYLAWASGSESGSVDVDEMVAYNARLFNDIQPARVRAEMSMYNARQNDIAAVFSNRDPEVLDQIQLMLQKGELGNCKDFQAVYDEACKNVSNDRLKLLDLNLAALASKRVECSDENVVNTVVVAIQTLDKEYATLDYKDKQAEIKELLHEIIASRPELEGKIKKGIQDAKLTSQHYVALEGDRTVSTVDKWSDYVSQIVRADGNRTGTETFVDQNGNPITDPKKIEAIKQANLNNLSELKTVLAQLERELNIAAADEGGLTGLGRSVASANVDGRLKGTYYNDLLSVYKYAQSKLTTMEQAANGTLKDAKGKTISYSDMQNEMRQYLDQIAAKNNDFKTTGAYAKMGVILAPVVATTVVATYGTGSAFWGGVFAGGTTYALNSAEYLTSRTGYTAERQESNVKESLVSAAATWSGGLYAKGAYAIETGNSILNATARGSVMFGGDMLTAATSEAYLSGEVSKKGMVAAGVLSLVGNAAAMKNLSASKSKVPHVEHPTTMKGSNAEILPKKSTPILDKSVKHIDADGNLGIANSSGVHIKTTKKAQDIIDEVESLLSRSEVSGSELARVRSKLNGISNEKIRALRSKVDTRAAQLSSSEKAAYSAQVREAQLSEVERIVNGKGPVREADGRALREYTRSTEDISELAALRDKIDVRRPGGAESRKIFDDRIAALNKANRTPSQIGEEVHQALDKAIATKKGLGDFNDLQAHIQATTDPAELNKLFNKWKQIRTSCGFAKKGIDTLFKQKGLDIAKPNNRLAETPVEPVAPVVKPQGDNFGNRAVTPESQEPLNQEFLNNAFNQKLQKSGIWETAGKANTVDRLGGEKLSKYTREFDDLCRYATTSKQLDELQTLANKFRGQAENTSFNASIARRLAELNGGIAREIYTDPHNILVDESPFGVVVEPYAGNNTFRLTERTSLSSGVPKTENPVPKAPVEPKIDDSPVVPEVMGHAKTDADLISETLGNKASKFSLLTACIKWFKKYTASGYKKYERYNNVT